MTSALAPVARTDEVVMVGTNSVAFETAGSGAALVFLHGATGPLWSPFQDRLSDHYRVLSAHMPGFGRSTRISSDRSPRDLAITLLQALDRLDIGPVHLVGSDLGGWVAAEMATMHQSALASLVLVGAAGIRPREGLIHDPMMESHVDQMQQCFSTDQAFCELFGPEANKELIALWDASREMTARITWKPWMWSLELPAHLQGVATKTLVVACEKDRVMPRDCAEQYSTLLPNSSLTVLAGAGHAAEFECPDALVSVIHSFTSTVKG